MTQPTDKTHENTNIKTGGGAHIEGDVTTDVFTGRDNTEVKTVVNINQVNYYLREPYKALAKLQKQFSDQTELTQQQVSALNMQQNKQKEEDKKLRKAIEEIKDSIQKGERKYRKLVDAFDKERRSQIRIFETTLRLIAINQGKTEGVSKALVKLANAVWELAKGWAASINREIFILRNDTVKLIKRQRSYESRQQTYETKQQSYKEKIGLRIGVLENSLTSIIKSYKVGMAKLQAQIEAQGQQPISSYPTFVSPNSDHENKEQLPPPTLAREMLDEDGSESGSSFSPESLSADTDPMVISFDNKEKRQSRSVLLSPAEESVYFSKPMVRAEKLPYKAYTQRTPEHTSSMLRIEYSNGTVGLFARHSLLEVLYTTPQHIAITFTNCLIDIKGHYLLKIFDLLQQAKVLALHCFDSERHEPPKEEEPLISSMERRDFVWSRSA